MTDEQKVMHEEFNRILKHIRELVKECEDRKWTNEMFFIGFEDELNEISVKDHNK